MKRVLLTCTLIVFSGSAFSWGLEGHTVVGELAVSRLDPAAGARLQSILGNLDPRTIAHACYWPDTMRPDPLWASAGPLHYVNIPRGDKIYSQSRDCPDGRCVTESIKYFADLLGDPTVLKESRAVAFGWLCHLVGDLHNPMHAGYADDEGGNLYDIIYLNKSDNLHHFWDATIIQVNSVDGPTLATFLERNLGQPEKGWQPGMADAWTNQSRSVLLQYGYPETARASYEFGARTWEIVQKQLATAGLRLAQVVNAELGSQD